MGNGGLEMNAKEWAKKLNGREIGNEITETESGSARVDGVVVMYGYSDDLVLSAGAFGDEEFDAYEGARIPISRNGFFKNRCADEECPYHDDEKKGAPIITAWWIGKGNPSWNISATFDHHTFEIMEDGEVFCRGIVFDVESVPETVKGER
jgi:hypothetical protein